MNYPSRTVGMAYGPLWPLIRALHRAIDEHGRPNSFGPSELAQYGGPDAMRCGRLARSFEGKKALEEIGIRYEDRRFIVMKDEPGA